MGDKMYENGDYKFAIRSYEAALKIEPGNKPAQDGFRKARTAMETEWEALRKLKRR